MKKIQKFTVALFFGFIINFFSLNLVNAEGCEGADGDTYCIEFQEHIGDTKAIKAENGVDLISAYIGLIYKYGASIIGIICVLILVVSGIQISAGGLNTEGVNQAKERIIQSLLSLILLFSSALILKTVNPNFFGNHGGEVATEGTAEYKGGEGKASEDTTETTAE